MQRISWEFLFNSTKGQALWNLWILAISPERYHHRSEPLQSGPWQSQRLNQLSFEHQTGTERMDLWMTIFCRFKRMSTASIFKHQSETNAAAMMHILLFPPHVFMRRLRDVKMWRQIAGLLLQGLLEVKEINHLLWRIVFIGPQLLLKSRWIDSHAFYQSKLHTCTAEVYIHPQPFLWMASKAWLIQIL